MNINATLLIQFVNFGIAWLVIKNLLVIPAMRLSAQQSKTFDELALRKDALKKTVNQAYDMQYSLWHGWYLRAQKDVREYYQPARVTHSPLAQVSSPEVHEQEIKDLTHTLTTLVVRRLQELP